MNQKDRSAKRSQVVRYECGQAPKAVAVTENKHSVLNELTRFSKPEQASILTVTLADFLNYLEEQKHCRTCSEYLRANFEGLNARFSNPAREDVNMLLLRSDLKSFRDHCEIHTHQPDYDSKKYKERDGPPRHPGEQHQKSLDVARDMLLNFPQRFRPVGQDSEKLNKYEVPKIIFKQQLEVYNSHQSREKICNTTSEFFSTLDPEIQSLFRLNGDKITIDESSYNYETIIEIFQKVQMHPPKEPPQNYWQFQAAYTIIAGEIQSFHQNRMTAHNARIKFQKIRKDIIEKRLQLKINQIDFDLYIEQEIKQQEAKKQKLKRKRQQRKQKKKQQNHNQDQDEDVLEMADIQAFNDQDEEDASVDLQTQNELHALREKLHQINEKRQQFRQMVRLEWQRYQREHLVPQQ